MHDVRFGWSFHKTGMLPVWQVHTSDYILKVKRWSVRGRQTWRKKEKEALNGGEARKQAKKSSSCLSFPSTAYAQFLYMSQASGRGKKKKQNSTSELLHSTTVTHHATHFRPTAQPRQQFACRLQLRAFLLLRICGLVGTRKRTRTCRPYPFDFLFHLPSLFLSCAAPVRGGHPFIPCYISSS